MTGGTDDPRTARRAVRLIFLVCGIASACWAPMVPYLKLSLAMDDAMLGLVLLALGGGAMTIMPLTGLIMARFSSRTTVFWSGLALCVAVPLLTLAPSPILLAAGLFYFGLTLGALDVAMNAQAVVVEKRTGRSVMAGFHGLFSVGGLVGAGMMGGLLWLGLSLTGATLIMVVFMVAVVLTQCRDLLPKSADSTSAGQKMVWPRGAVLVLGMLCFIAFLAEGAVLDWSAVFLRFSRGFDPAMAGNGYAVFSVAMALGRLTGDKVTQRLGPVAMMRYGGILAAAGYLLAVSVPHGWAGLLGFALVGLGAANVVPVMFSAAGRLKDVPASIAIPTVVTLGYTGILLGPAAIGLVADLTSLPVALGGIAGLLLVVAACAGIARR